jgi:DNA-directed RNA polymerase alpha subunit
LTKDKNVCKNAFLFLFMYMGKTDKPTAIGIDKEIGKLWQEVPQLMTKLEQGRDQGKLSPVQFEQIMQGVMTNVQRVNRLVKRLLTEAETDWKSPQKNKPKRSSEVVEDLAMEQLMTPLMDLNLKLDARVRLKTNGIDYLGDLIQLEETDLKKRKKIGRLTILDTKDFLLEHGYHLGTNLPVQTRQEFITKRTEINALYSEGFPGSLIVEL